jgi:hypothetical protein
MSVRAYIILAGLCLANCVPSVLAQPSNSPSGQSGSKNAGNTSAGEKPTHADAEGSSASTVSEPAPFGGAWDSRPKFTGSWGGLREQLRDHGLTFDISATTYYQGVASGGLGDGIRIRRPQ